VRVGSISSNGETIKFWPPSSLHVLLRIGSTGQVDSRLLFRKKFCGECCGTTVRREKLL
jgi:hypothetical protein